MFLGLSYYFIFMNLYLYSLFGWIYESTMVSIRERKLVNRGFLIGPILPLYGFGGTFVYVFLRPLAAYPSLLFAGGMILATTIEFITSWLMEKFFHAQWWDYSKEPYNFQGRIALIPSMFWGILSLVAFDFLQPAISAIIYAIPQQVGVIFLHIAFVITATDFIYTTITTINFSKQLETLYHFRDELMLLLEEGQFTSLKEIITSTTQNLSERTDSLRNRLLEIKATYTENDSLLSNIEARFREYLETHFSFQKKNRFFGNGRLLQAFPTMKFIPRDTRKKTKEPYSFRVKEFLIQLSDLRTKKESSEKEESKRTESK